LPLVLRATSRFDQRNKVAAGTFSLRPVNRSISRMGRVGDRRPNFSRAMRQGGLRLLPQSVHAAFIDNARLFLRVRRIKREGVTVMKKKGTKKKSKGT